MNINFNRIQGGICFSVKLDQDDRREGVRIQGDKTRIELLTDKIFFKVSPSEINEDHIAFAALAIFLPFMSSIDLIPLDFLTNNFVPVIKVT